MLARNLQRMWCRQDHRAGMGVRKGFAQPGFPAPPSGRLCLPGAPLSRHLLAVPAEGIGQLSAGQVRLSSLGCILCAEAGQVIAG